jgi:hypothetical protein
VCKDYGKDNKAYFHGRYVDLMWYGRKGIKRRIKGVCGSFLHIRYYYYMWLGKLSWGRNVYVTLERQEENMEIKCTLIIAMENS